MIASKMVVLLFVFGCLIAKAIYGQDDDSIYGTHAVVFQPVQSAGSLQGCTLVYRAVQADYAYRRGKPIVIVGNIAVHQFGTKGFWD